jgi:hypothetical protein
MLQHISDFFFLFRATYYALACRDHILSLNLSISGLMPLWTGVWKYLLDSLLSIPLGVSPKVEFLDHVTFYVYFLRHDHTVFHSSCNILHSHQQCTRILISPPPHQYLLLSPDHVRLAILMGVRGTSVWFWFVSLIIIDVKHLFLSLLLSAILWRNFYSCHWCSF